jgi:hypothetical protein
MMNVGVMMGAYIDMDLRRCGSRGHLEGSGARALRRPTELRATVPQRADIPERIDATWAGRGKDG